jgi:hypothetical protein
MGESLYVGAVVAVLWAVSVTAVRALKNASGARFAGLDVRKAE